MLRESAKSLLLLSLVIPTPFGGVASADSVVSHSQINEQTDATNTSINSDGDESMHQTEIRRTHVGTDNPAPDQRAGQAATDSASVDRTSITEKQTSPSAFLNEAVGFKPQAGIVSLNDGAGQGNTRGILGMTMDINVLRRVRTEGGRPYVGPSLGVFYSHLGTSGSDFFGANGSGGQGGTQLLMLPVDLKAGYTFSDVFRPSIHGGANFTYTSMSAPVAGFSVSDSSWSTNPNLGLDLEFGVGKNVGLLLRPDWTFASSITIFTGTMGIVIPIS